MAITRIIMRHNTSVARSHVFNGLSQCNLLVMSLQLKRTAELYLLFICIRVNFTPPPLLRILQKCAVAGRCQCQSEGKEVAT